MKITESGTYSLKGSQTTGTTVALISGDFGGATLTLGYFDDYKNFIPFVDGGVTGTNTQYVIEHGLILRPVLNVASASGTTEISVISTGIK